MNTIAKSFSPLSLSSTQVPKALDAEISTCLGGKQVRLINTPPVTGGIYSYGKVLGVFASAIIALLLLLQLVPPLGKWSVRLIDRIRTHQKELQHASIQLTQQRWEALRTALSEFPTVNYQQATHQSLGAADMAVIQKLGLKQPHIDATVARLVATYDEQQWKNTLLQGLDEEGSAVLSAVKECSIYRFLTQAKTIPQIQTQAAWFSLALLKKELNQRAEHLACVQDQLPANIQQKLLNLAPSALEVKGLEQFLMDKKILGKKVASPQFKAAVQFLKFHVQRLRNENVFSHIDVILDVITHSNETANEAQLQKEVRERLDQVIRSDIYSVLMQREGSEHPVIKLVHRLTCALRLESQGISELGELGRLYLTKVEEERGIIPKNNQYVYVSDVMDDAITKHHWSYRIESLFDKLLVLARYPEKTMMAYIGHRESTALEYNSHKIGNWDMAYGDYSLGNTAVRALVGPTPTGDALFLAHLDAVKEVQGIHLQHNLEHPGFSPGDRVRVKYLMELEQQYPQTLRLFSTPLDGKAWKLKGDVGQYFTDYQTAEEFFLKFGTFAFTNSVKDPVTSFDALEGTAHRQLGDSDDNGFYIGRDVMSDTQVKLAFKCASEAFAHTAPSSYADRYRLTRALEVGVEGIIAVGALVKTLKDTAPEDIQEELWKATFGQACKLDIDRGVVMNVMTRVYFDIMAGRQLDENRVNEIIGLVIGRAELVAGRTIITDRYQPLSDALRLIGSDEERIRYAFRSYMQDAFDVDVKESLVFNPLVEHVVTTKS